MTTGIDISSYQGPINYGAVRNAGIDWVGIRVLHGQEDMFFRRNRDGFGFARHRLLYHFLDPGNPEAQADHFLGIIGKLQPGEAAMLDAEGGLTVPDAVRWCNRVEAATGRPVAVYTGGYIDGGRMWSSPQLNNGQRARVFAAYSDELSAKAIHAKGIPWDAWQYTSHGAVAGIAGSCDLDRVDSIATFDRVCGVVPPPPPTPTGFYPLQHQYGTYPNEVPKPELHYGDGYTVGIEKRNYIEYFKYAAVVEAGQNTYGTAWFVYEIYAVQACQMIQRFFGLPVTGVVDAATWGVIDYLAGPRPR